jgi:hypothetical protein
MPSLRNVDVNTGQERNDKVMGVIQKTLLFVLPEIRMHANIAMILEVGANEKNDIRRIRCIHQRVPLELVVGDRSQQPFEVVPAVDIDGIVRSRQHVDPGHFR